MSSLEHHEVQELLGVYAVNAVSPEERARIEAHLFTCVDCRTEADQLLQTAASLGAAPLSTPVDDVGPLSAPDANLWTRIEAELHPSVTPPPLRIPDLNSRRRSSNPAKWLGAAAAALALVLGIGVVAQWPDRDSNRAQFSEQAEAARDAATLEGARRVTLKSTDGQKSAEVVLLPDGRGYFLDTALPALDVDRTYQLWAIMSSGNVVSAGIFGRDPSFNAFTAAGDVTTLAITEEIGGGVVRSANQPVVSAVVRSA